MRKILKVFWGGFLWLSVMAGAHADSLFFEDEPIQNGINVFDDTPYNPVDRQFGNYWIELKF